MESAAWDDAAQRWVVETSAGRVTSTTLVVAAGGLSEPRLPDIEGIDDFGGALFHSARWDHDVDLRGKRVAVIGTGASAIQIVPELQQRVAGHLDVYQRTAPYVLPRHDRRYGRLEKLALRHVPGLQRAYRTAIYWGREGYVPGFTWQPRLAWPAKRMALAQPRQGGARPRAAGAADAGVRDRLQAHPDLQHLLPGARLADNVEVVTDGIARITEHGVVTRDGRERPVDVLVVATGFFATELPIAERITGREGRTLADTWAEGGMAAYKGTTVPGFPNLFMLVGPNTGLGHSSMVFMIESQVEYLRDAVRTMAAHRYAAVEPTPAATRAWNDGLQRRMRRTVWSTGGCASWYLDAHGRNTVLWPRTTVAFRRLLARFDVAAYDVAAPLTPEHHPHREEVTA